MAKCMACGKTALFTTTFGNVTLCKNCGSLINASAWNTREFDSMDVLVGQKEDALQRAKSNNMPQNIIDEITRFFDEYINAGFIITINGKAGQILKLFANQCIITTKNENAKLSLENILCEFDEFDDDDDNDDDDTILSSEQKKQLAKGLMSGKILSAGIGAAVSATINQQEKEKNEERKSREWGKTVGKLIKVGDRNVLLNTVTSAEIAYCPNVSRGYLKLIPKDVAADDVYKCQYFFFNTALLSDGKRIKQKVEYAKNAINERISLYKQEIQKAIELEEENKIRKQTEQMRAMVEEVTKNATQQNKQDAFEEVRKFKQLLDEGIISEEEFNIKKKELLGL